MYEIFGLDENDEVPTYETVYNLIHPEDQQLSRAIYQKSLKEKGSYRVEYRIIRKDGLERTLSEQADVLLDENKNVVRLIGSTHDITEQKKREEKLTYIASHDYLTDLPNRRMFMNELNALIDNSALFDTQFAVMLIDVDGFKRINDTLGHVIGDKLLVEVSSRLLKSITSSAFVSRIDGDEFTVLIRLIQDIEQPIYLAKNMIADIDEPYFINDYELYVTASIGIATYPNDGDDGQNLLNKADAALNMAKEIGKNNYQIYNSSMTIESFKLFSLEKGLRNSIKNNELVLYYQPKVDSKTGIMVGAEALIRWQHPEWGLVSPQEFIPLAEENGFIFKMTDWAILTVCKQLKYWEEMNIPLVPISVNISPKRLLRNDWIDKIIQTLMETKVDPNLLELEITESALIQNEETFISSIEKLKKLGVKLTLDDFGTVFSSLQHLRKFKVDSIKIDKDFVKDIAKEKDEIIIKSIIFLAHELKMDVVAEGVENVEQLTFLRQQGCDQIQGYLFSTRVPVENFSKLLIKNILKPNIHKKGKPIENKRKLFRFDLPIPLSADMTIIQIKGNSIKLGKTEVLIEDIGIGGLKFLTHIKLPVNPEITLEFETQILGEIIQVIGCIVWSHELKDNLYQYGLQFKINESEQTTLTALLNKFTIQIRKERLPKDCRFIEGNKRIYSKKLGKTNQ